MTHTCSFENRNPKEFSIKSLHLASRLKSWLGLMVRPASVRLSVQLPVRPPVRTLIFILNISELHVHF